MGEEGKLYKLVLDWYIVLQFLIVIRSSVQGCPGGQILVRSSLIDNHEISYKAISIEVFSSLFAATARSRLIS